MIEMLVKQLLGNVDLNEVKGQVQQFAKAFADMSAKVNATHDAVARLERILKATDATLLQERTLSNVNDNHHGNCPEQPSTGTCGGDCCGSDHNGGNGNGNG